MTPRIIHLIWFGEQKPESLAAAAFWREHAQGREVRVYTDASCLRESWRENYDAYAHNFPNQSDWLRWSLLLDLGGWYFDAKVRPANGIDLDKIEAGMAPDTCLVVPMIAGMRGLDADIICCPLGWRGENAVNEYMLAKHAGQPAYVHYTLGMANRLYHTHPDWFTIGSARMLRNDRRNVRRQLQNILRDCAQRRVKPGVRSAQ